MRIVQGDFNGAELKVGIVISRVNDVATKQLLAGVLDGLRRHGVGKDDLSVVYVPGLLDLPLACRKLAARGAVDVVIALGVALIDAVPGDPTTAAVVNGIVQASLQSGIPINAAIASAPTLLHALQQASERGAAAATAAIEMARVLKAIDA